VKGVHVGKHEALKLLLLLLALFTFSAAGRISGGDEETMFRLCRNLVERGDITVEKGELTLEPARFEGLIPTRLWSFPSTLATRGREGRSYSKYGLGQSGAAMPLYVAGKALGEAIGFLGPHYGSRWAVALVNPLMLAATSFLLFAFSRSLGFRKPAAYLVAFGYGFGSMAWPYVKTFYAEPSVAFFLLASAYFIHRGKSTRMQPRYLLGSGTALALAVLFRPTSAIAIPALLVYLSTCYLSTPSTCYLSTPKSSLKRSLLWLAPLAAVSLFQLLYNHIRFGHPLNFGYPEARWDTPFVLGLYGLLFSPGKGLFVYSPLLASAVVGLRGLWKRDRGLSLLVSLLAVSFIVFYAPYRFWTGGWNWGPRFLLPIVPFLSLGCAPLAEEAPGEKLVVALVVLGILIQLPAIVADHSRYLVSLWQRYPDDYYTRSVYQPSFSPIMRQPQAALEVVRNLLNPEARDCIRQRLQEEEPAIRREADPDRASDALLRQMEFLRLNVPDFWWVHWWIRCGFAPGG